MSGAMATAAVCCPSTVTASVTQPSSARLALPCAGLRLQRRISQRRCAVDTRNHRRVGGIRAGLPVISSVPVVGPLANAIFNPVLLFIVYAAGAFRFYSGFRKTTYADAPASKISMTALWPVLFLASKAYRDNFKKAIS